ncbi:importin-9 [Anaeramoeba flamelloides]|uniref:Importin-9 n=1 Tax=Anaeramoeba flamelloides TaxID=1746091 RepID=A0ABQ8Y2N2_9EUKA|nr:importin-9 [Anaeramoeba flamelloides]
MNNLLELLEGSLSTNNTYRKECEENLFSSFDTKGFGLHLLEVAFNNELEYSIKQLSLIVLRTMIRNNWKKGLNENDKELIASTLFEHLGEGRISFLKLISAALGEIGICSDQDTLKELLEMLFSIVTNILPNNNNNNNNKNEKQEEKEIKSYGSLECLIFILERLNGNDSKFILPFLIKQLLPIIYDEGSISVDVKSNCLKVIYTHLMKLNHDLDFRIDLSEVGDLFKELFALLIASVSQEIQVDHNCKFEILGLQILGFFIDNKPDMLYEQLEKCVESLIKFLDYGLKIFEVYWIYPDSNNSKVEEINSMPLIENGELIGFPSLISLCFQFFQNLITNFSGEIEDLISKSLNYLIPLLIDYIPLTEINCQDWIYNLEAYLLEEDDEEVTYVVRSACKGVLLELIDENFDEIMPLILVNIENKLKEILEFRTDKELDLNYLSNEPSNFWKTSESILFILGLCSRSYIMKKSTELLSQANDIISYITKIYSIVFLNLNRMIDENQKINEQDHVLYPFLIGRLLWVIGRLCESLPQDLRFQTFLFAVNVITYTNTSTDFDFPIPIKVASYQNLINTSGYIEKEDFIKSLSGGSGNQNQNQNESQNQKFGLFSSIIGNLSKSEQIDSDFVILTLDLLTTLLTLPGAEVALNDYINDFLVTIVETWWNFLSDRFIVPLCIEIINKVSAIEIYQENVFEIVLPACIKVFHSEEDFDSQIISDTLDLIRSTFPNDKQIEINNKDIFLPLFFNILHLIHKNNNIEILQTATGLIRSLISQIGNCFENWGVPKNMNVSFNNNNDNNGLDLLLITIDKLLNDKNEIKQESLIFMGSLITKILELFQEKLSKNGSLEPLLTLILDKFLNTNYRMLMKSLLQVFCHIIQIDAQSFVDFVDQFKKLTQVIGIWIGIFDISEVSFETKIELVALGQLLSHSFENELLQNIQVVDEQNKSEEETKTLYLPVKILQLFARILLQDENDGESDDDDDEQSEDDDDDYEDEFGLLDIARLAQDDPDEKMDDWMNEFYDFDQKENPIFTISQKDIVIRFLNNFTSENFEKFKQIFEMLPKNLQNVIENNLQKN